MCGFFFGLLNCRLFGCTGYYSLIRSCKVKATSTVNVILDVDVIKKFIQNVSLQDLSAFNDWFDEFFEKGSRESVKTTGVDKLNAMMIVTAIALMNVQDLSGNEYSELLPFLQALVQDEYLNKQQPFQAMAYILFGSCENDVSSV